MPYNNAPISAQEEVTGSSVLPLARVKKIIAMDDDIAQCSNSAAFAISIATEMFIRQLTQQAHNVVKSERKPRRNLQYKDFATAVARIDNLEFLSDVIPRTTTFKQFKEKKAREAANGVSVEAGQTTLDRQHPAPQTEEKLQAMAQPGQVNGMNGTAMTGVYPQQPPPAAAMHQTILSPTQGSPMADRTVQPSNHLHASHGDVEMTG